MTQENEPRRLTKSRTDRMLDGVCGGVAEYFHVDPTPVRIAWVLVAIFGGTGIVLYIVAMILMPAGAMSMPASGGIVSPPAPRDTNTKVWGILLVAVGVIWLGGNLGFPLWHHWWRLSFEFALPVLLILGGIALLYGGRKSDPVSARPAETTEMPAGASPADTPRRVYRSRSERKFMGVCGGFATYLNVDPTIVRLALVFAVFGSFGAAVVAYFIMALVIPEEPLRMSTANM